MNLAPIFITLVVGPIIAGGIITGILQGSLRETTGIFDRWLHQPAAQQQEMTDALQNAGLNPNTSNRDDEAIPSGGGPSGGTNGDHDGDTITNGDEVAIGFDPRNPDTNGDGLDDRIEIKRGMVLDKTVNGGEQTSAQSGEEVTYEMKATWYVLTDQDSTLTFLDPKPDGIGFVEGYYEFNGKRTELEDWPVRLDFPVSSKNDYKLNINITAQVATCAGKIINEARISGAGSTNEPVTDKATIVVSPYPTRLLIDSLIKTANGEHWLETTEGATVNFQILGRVTFDTCNEERTIVFQDIDSGGLEFVSGSLSFAGATRPLTRIPDDLTFTLEKSGTYTLEIRFSAKVTGPGTTTNKARLYEQENPNNERDDIVFITITETPQPPVINLLKEGRLENSPFWGHYIFANNEDTVEFRVLPEIGEDNMGLIDALPKGLLYVPNTLRLFYENEDTQTPEFILRRVFDLGIPLDKGPGKYALYFFAKVNAAAPFSLTNTASLISDYLSGNPKTAATAEATVISK